MGFSSWISVCVRKVRIALDWGKALRWGRMRWPRGSKGPRLTTEVHSMSDDPNATSPLPEPPAAPTLADLAAAPPADPAPAPSPAPSPPADPAPTPDPVVTTPPSLEDLAKSVEDAQTAHIQATDKANASAAQAASDRAAQRMAHDTLHAAVSALIEAAKADDPA